MKPTPRSKAAMVDLASIGSITADQRPVRNSMVTAPGQAAQNSMLRKELEQFANAHPVRPLDPNLIDHSFFANRHAHSLRDNAFLELKESIKGQGRNTEPIKVRPHPTQPNRYELISGHRRHACCLQLGIPVIAMIVPLNDEQLFLEMDYENRLRKDLRPYELGLQFERGLEKGIRKNLRDLADFTKHSLATVSQALTIARLPKPVLEAFESPLDIQYRWASGLAHACDNRLAEVLEASRVIQAMKPRPSAHAVFERLTRVEAKPDPDSAPFSLTIPGGAGQQCSVKVNPRTNKIRVDLSKVDPARVSELEELLKKFLA